MSRPGDVSQTPGVLARTIGDEAMLLHPSGTPALALNETAAAVWAHCAEPTDLETLVGSLAASYRADPAAVRADVEPVLEQMVSLGFLHRA